MAGLKIDRQVMLVTGQTKKPVISETKAKVGTTHKKWSNKTKEAFYLELSVMLAAGVDIKSSLELITNKQSKQQITITTTQVKEEVINGASLSDAIKHTRIFTAYEYFTIRIGEETGRVSSVLNGLAEHYGKRVRLRRLMIQALSYPVMVLVTACSAIVFMLRFIVPLFSEVFSRFGGELPSLTKFIINASAFMQSYLIWVLAGFVISFGVLVIYKNNVYVRSFSSAFLLKIPVLGDTIRCVYMARLCEAFSLLISAKVPLVQSVSLVGKMIGFYPIEVSLTEVEDSILRGKSLHDSLAQYSIYDQRLLALIKVGEEANKLDFFFTKLAGYYSEEVEHRSSVLSSVLEPVIIIVLGVIVGVVLLAMYLPLFELSTTIQ